MLCYFGLQGDSSKVYYICCRKLHYTFKLQKKLRPSLLEFDGLELILINIGKMPIYFQHFYAVKRNVPSQWICVVLEATSSQPKNGGIFYQLTLSKLSFVWPESEKHSKHLNLFQIHKEMVPQEDVITILKSPIILVQLRKSHQIIQNFISWKALHFYIIIFMGDPVLLQPLRA